ncbi:MAG: hypothetical protein CSA33_08110 [Desulfobulbus propionicus]|nr:MAG: hypothetical protein CSA33_08110 [Desulfobulbus propionicus]
MSLSILERKEWVKQDSQYSTRRQSRLAGISRSVIYSEPASKTDANLTLMRLIDEQCIMEKDGGNFKSADALVMRLKRGHPTSFAYKSLQRA